MLLSFYLTKKYLRSKKNSRFISFISLITILGIAIGMTVVIIALTVLDGYDKVVSEKIINFNSHIKIISFGNRNLPEPASVIPKIEEKFRGSVSSVNPFVSKLAIIKSKKMTEGITLLGISERAKELEFKNFIQNGGLNFSQMSSMPKMILGRSLAQKFFVKAGDRVTTFSLHKDQVPTFENPPSIQQFEISGIFESGMSEFDDAIAFINIAEAQKIFGMGEKISGYDIRVSDISKINLIAEQLQDFLGYPYYVRTVFQIHQNIFTWLELQKEPIPIVLGLIIFVAVFNIVGTLLMIVLERTTTVGILRSMGADRKLIIKTFLLHAVFLSIVGVIAGNILALTLSMLQQQFDLISLPEKIYFVTKVPLSIELKNYLLVTFVTFTVSLLASMLPAIIASKIKPISAIRFD